MQYTIPVKVFIIFRTVKKFQNPKDNKLDRSIERCLYVREEKKEFLWEGVKALRSPVGEEKGKKDYIIYDP